jgi:hypothetical protein
MTFLRKFLAVLHSASQSQNPLKDYLWIEKLRTQLLGVVSKLQAQLAVTNPSLQLPSTAQHGT